jgi:hypothetical protein
VSSNTNLHSTSWGVASDFEEGVEQCIDTFWENADLAGQDKDDPDAFNTGCVVSLKSSGIDLLLFCENMLTSATEEARDGENEREVSGSPCRRKRKANPQGDEASDVSRKRFKPASTAFSDMSDLTELSESEEDTE